MNSNDRYGECGRHPYHNMMNCPECQMENDLQKVFIPKRPKQKISPCKPVMQINEDNALWIQHNVAKRRKNPKDQLLVIEIGMEKITVNFAMEEKYNIKVFTGDSKHDINEAIRNMIDQYATYNLASLFRK